MVSAKGGMDEHDGGRVGSDVRDHGGAAAGAASDTGGGEAEVLFGRGDGISGVRHGAVGLRAVVYTPLKVQTGRRGVYEGSRGRGS